MTFQAEGAEPALPGQTESSPHVGCSLKLRSCLSRFGQATEAKPAASGGMQGQGAAHSERPRGSVWP